MLPEGARDEDRTDWLSVNERGDEEVVRSPVRSEAEGIVGKGWGMAGLPARRLP